MRFAHLLLASVVPLACASVAHCYIPNQRWTSTASGSTGTVGDPVTLTWSIVPNGTNIPGEGTSILITFLDGTFGAGPGGSNLTQRPWFSIFSDSFNRWSQLGGITFIYESHDNGSQMQSSSGILGTRGDIRIGGASIDGDGGTLAYTWFPNSGDIVIDTGEADYFHPTPYTTLPFRNTLMHEIGHAFGLDHVESNTNNFLLEPFISTAFDGPQLDDIRGIQGQYGDAREKSNGGLGNDIAANATGLGALVAGSNLQIGGAAAPDQVVSSNETDFVSIANSTDTDFYSFTIASPVTLAATLTPLGGVFNQAGQGQVQSSFDANARNDLSLTVFASNGTTQLGFANSTAAGQVEALAGINLTSAGQYFARITGADANVQLYQLQLSATALVAGDYNRNGVVDAADYIIWRNTLNQSGANLPADGSGNSLVDANDYTIWRSNFGKTATSGSGGELATGGVPEPGGHLLLLIAAMTTAQRRNRGSHGASKKHLIEVVK